MKNRGQRSKVRGQISKLEVRGQRSDQMLGVKGWKSKVSDKRSKIKGQRSKVRVHLLFRGESQRPEITGQKSKVKGQRSDFKH